MLYLHHKWVYMKMISCSSSFFLLKYLSSKSYFFCCIQNTDSFISFSFRYWWRHKSLEYKTKITETCGVFFIQEEYRENTYFAILNHLVSLWSLIISSLFIQLPTRSDRKIIPEGKQRLSGQTDELLLPPWSTYKLASAQYFINMFASRFTQCFPNINHDE